MKFQQMMMAAQPIRKPRPAAERIKKQLIEDAKTACFPKAAEITQGGYRRPDRG